MRIMLLASMLLISFLTGCTHANEKKSGKEQTLTTGSSKQTKFESGVFIDISKFKNDFLTDDILQILKNNLEALVNKDKKNFIAGFIEGHAPGNMFLIETADQYRFLNVSSTQNDQEDKRINVGIEYEILHDQEIENKAFFYTFEPDKNGKWKIAIID
jgi:hypothetical protein